MNETVIVKGRVCQEARDRLRDIVRESGRDEEDLVGEAVERLLHDDYWENEIARRLAVPASDRRHVDPHEMDKWVQSLRDGKPIPVVCQSAIGSSQPMCRTLTAGVGRPQ